MGRQDGPDDGHHSGVASFAGREGQKKGINIYWMDGWMHGWRSHTRESIPRNRERRPAGMRSALVSSRPSCTPYPTPSPRSLPRSLVYTARATTLLLYLGGMSVHVRLFAHPLPHTHPHNPLHSTPLTVLCLPPAAAGRVAAAAQSVCLTHVRWKSINILQ